MDTLHDSQKGKRLHHRARMIEKARSVGRRLFSYHRLKDPQEYEKLVDEFARHNYNHLRSCSCSLCGNPRRYHKDKLTMQERKFKSKCKDEF